MSEWKYFNPNPRTTNPTGKTDCVIRAICAGTDKTWKQVYAAMSVQGFSDGDNWANDVVWGNYLEMQGWTWYRIPNTCPRCYTVSEFAHDNLNGTWILGTGAHAVCVRNGEIWDSWDSSNAVPLFAWRKPDQAYE